MGLLKYILKQNEEKRKSGAIFDLIHEKIAADAEKSGQPPEALDDLNKKFEKLGKIGFTPDEATNIGKMITPDLFQSDIAKAIKEQTLVNAQNKPQEDAQKQFNSIIEKNNPLKASSRSGLGMAANATQRADRALALLDNDILTNQDLQGIVGDYAGILQGGAPTVQGMQELEYKSAQQSLKAMSQYMSGNPQDAVPQKFKDHIKKNLLELKTTSDGYIQKNFSAVEKAYAPVISKFPDEWNNFKSEWVPQGSTSKPSAPKAMPSRSSAPKGAKGWDTEKGDWVF